MYYNTLSIFITVISAILIAQIGDRRVIGGFWPFFFSFTFTPLIGLMTALLSKKLKKYSSVKGEKPYTLKLIFGITLIFVGTLATAGLAISSDREILINSSQFLVGMVGAGIYFVLDSFYVIEKVSLNIVAKTYINQPYHKENKKFRNIDYDAKITADNLKHMIPDMLMRLSNEKKVLLLDLYLQPNHDNPFNDDFKKYFPKFNYSEESNISQYKTIVYCLDYSDDDEETSDVTLLEYLKNIHSQLEIFRLCSVIYMLMGDITNSKLMLNNARMAFKGDQSPKHYLHLINYTELKQLIYLQDIPKLMEIIGNYTSSFFKYHEQNNHLISLNERFKEIM